MKKIYLSAMFAGLGALAAFGQSFEATTYRGAFAPAPTAMWTDGWSNWDPQNTNYGSPTVTITTNITSNTTWTAGNIYLLQGQIYVKNNATLTIEPGTIIMGDKAVLGSGLFITKGAKLMAEGTANSPIVFTSNQAAGSRAAGDWGGLILLGKAANNQPSGVANIEGLAPTTDTEFGGGTTPDAHDNSGTLKYVRVEFPGYAYQQDKEINGITFGSVGDATVIDYVQVSFSNDDSYEWFGGTVNCKHLVAYRGLDDDFDTDNGFSGKVQFGLIVRDPDIADNPSVSTSEGFESDNDASGSTSTPQTHAIFSNITAIGPYRGNPSSTVAAGYRRGARIRRNSALNIRNSIFMDFVRGVHIDGSACEGNATSGLIIYKNNIVAGNSPGKVTEVNTGSTFPIQAWFAAGMNDSIVSTANILVTPYNYTSPDYRPAANSPLLTGSDFTGLVGLIENSAIAGVSLYPNPTNANATLFVDVAQDNEIEVIVMNSNGQVIQTVASKYAEVGTHEFTINSSTFAQGLYYAVVKSANAVKTVKLSVVK
ncbi:T9SS type A sorting domain-containing protein [Fluviicola sp.]|uniref:T9SS type A sorting domain-containing protein n=1 Tax=Fluviicola sp. TaxID=1917219 RepID=UPI0031CE08C6